MGFGFGGGGDRHVSNRASALVFRKNLVGIGSIFTADNSRTCHDPTRRGLDTLSLPD